MWCYRNNGVLDRRKAAILPEQALQRYGDARRGDGDA